MTDLERWQALKKRAADLQRRNDQVVGAARQIKEGLKRDHGVDDEEAARRMLKKLRREEGEREDALKRALDELEAAWPEEA